MVTSSGQLERGWETEEKPGLGDRGEAGTESGTQHEERAGGEEVKLVRQQQGGRALQVSEAGGHHDLRLTLWELSNLTFSK